MGSWNGPVPSDPTRAGEIPRGPIVYRLRLLEPTGARRSIKRFQGCDPDGILLIGETVNGRTRFKELAGAVGGARVGRGHGPGFTLFHWFQSKGAEPERLRFEWVDLGPWVNAFGDQKKLAQAAELLVIEDYRGRHADLPPCNTQGPKWWAVTKWMADKWAIPVAGVPPTSQNQPA